MIELKNCVREDDYAVLLWTIQQFSLHNKVIVNIFDQYLLIFGGNIKFAGLTS